MASARHTIDDEELQCSHAKRVSVRSYTSDKINLMSLAHSGSGERFYQLSGA